MDTPLTPTVDVRPADSATRPTSAGWTPSTPSPSATTIPQPTPTTGCCWSTTTTSSTPGTGFETHPHQDMEIVTWVLRGLAGAPGLHRPLRRHLPGPGAADERRHRHPALGEERLLAAVRATPHSDPVHFVQMWVVPDEAGITPGYEQLEIDDELLAGGLVPVASGMAKHDGAAAIRIKNKYAALYAARLQPGQSVNLPDAPFLHLFVPRGTVTLEGAGPLGDGDAVRFTATGGQQVTATEPAEILVWEMHATLG